jgi:hypothetical protein
MNAPSVPPDEQPPTYLNIAISKKGLSEFSGGQRIIFIPKEQVQTIEIRVGFVAERPLIQGIFGLVLLGLGCVGLPLIYEGGLYGLRWGIGFLIFGGIGGYSLYEALKKGYHLRVICSHDTRKLVFKGKIQKTEFSQFLRSATGLGYSFRDCINERDIT